MRRKKDEQHDKTRLLFDGLKVSGLLNDLPRLQVSSPSKIVILFSRFSAMVIAPSLYHFPLLGSRHYNFRERNFPHNATRAENALTAWER